MLMMRKIMRTFLAFLRLVSSSQPFFQMHSDKASDPGGLNSAFFKRFQNVCGVELFHTGKSWLEIGKFPLNLNDANIVLIPKVENHLSMKDLRPISLCNVIYKIISKVLTNCMKLLLHKCISRKQSTFLEDHSILNNVLVAIETLHHLKMGEMTLKIDISKAYDRVD